MFRAIQAAGKRQHGDDQEALGDGEVVDHAYERCLELDFPSWLSAIRADAAAPDRG